MTEIIVGRKLLGSQGLEVSEQGLGCMGMSAFYGTPKPEDEMVALIQKGVQKGVTFLDTADVYGPHTNEVLVGKAIKGIRDKVQIATKFGNLIDENGHWSVRGDPKYVRKACEASLKRLDIDYIDLYYQHRVDTKVPIEATVGEMKKLVEEGKVKYLGLSEASASTIRRAHKIHPISAVQLEWSLWTRDVEDEIIPTCRELGIGIVAYSPLGRGFFSGKAVIESLENTDFRNIAPRFSPENLEKNRILYERVAELAAKKKSTPGQLALAWVQNQGPDVVPIPGTTKSVNLEENVLSTSLHLSFDEILEISSAVPFSDVSGLRYPEFAMSSTFQNCETPPFESWKG